MTMRQQKPCARTEMFAALSLVTSPYKRCPFAQYFNTNLAPFSLADPQFLCRVQTTQDRTSLPASHHWVYLLEKCLIYQQHDHHDTNIPPQIRWIYWAKNYSGITQTLGLQMTSIVSSASRKAGGICVHTAYLIQLSAPLNLETPPPTTTIVLYMRFFISSLSEHKKKKLGCTPVVFRWTTKQVCVVQIIQYFFHSFLYSHEINNFRLSVIPNHTLLNDLQTSNITSALTAFVNAEKRCLIDSHQSVHIHVILFLQHPLLRTSTIRCFTFVLAPRVLFKMFLGFAQQVLSTGLWGTPTHQTFTRFEPIHSTIFAWCQTSLGN